MVRRRLPLVVGLLAMAVAAVACGGSGRAPGRAVIESPAVLRAQADFRQVVYTAAMTVRVGDAQRAAERASGLTTAAGGFVFAVTTDLEGRREARLTIKVPPERFEPVMVELAGLGTAVDRDVKARDVTEEVVDLDGRRQTAQASVARLQALLGEARTAADLVVVETELAKRQSELESLQGRLRVITSQVDLATINVRFTEQARPELARGVPGFGTAVHAGWIVLRNVFAAAVAAAGFLLPFTPLLVAAAWTARRYRRRTRRSVSSSTS